MASYVLTADIWFRQGDVEQTRYVKGDVLEDLSDAEVRNLKRAGAIAEPKSDAGKRAVERAEAAPEAPDLTATPQPTGFQQAEYGTVLANSGLGPDDASGGKLSGDQQADEADIDAAKAEAITAARAAGGAGARVGAGELAAAERPAKSATLDEWRRWAVTSKRISADEAEGKSKSELQAL